MTCFRTRFNRESPPAVHDNVHSSVCRSEPSWLGSRQRPVRARLVGPRNRSALRRPVYGPYIGRASAARLITLSRMIYSVAGPQSGARGVTVVAADVRRPVDVAVTCRHLSRRPGARARLPGARASRPQTEELTARMDGLHLLLVNHNLCAFIARPERARKGVGC